MPKAISLLLALSLTGATLAGGGAVRAESAGAYLAARSADMASDFVPARTYLIQALAADPQNLGLMEALVLAQVSLGEFEAALPVARLLNGAGETSQVAQLLVLSHQLIQGDYAAAREKLAAEDGIGGALIDPLLRGWADLGAGSMAKAIAEFEGVSKTKGLEAFGRYHKALALALAGDYESAEPLLADPQNALMATRRGVLAHVQVLSQLDRAPEALARLNEAFSGISDPELVELRERLAAGEALDFNVLRSAQDGMAETFHIVSLILQGEAAPSQILLHSRLAEYLRPDHGDAKLLSASALEVMGQEDLAIATYGQIAPDSPAHFAAETGKVQALYRSGQTNEAIEAQKKLVGEFGDFLGSHVALADLYQREENFEAAAASYQKAIDLLEKVERHHWSLFFSLGTSLERAKQWEEAEVVLRRTLEIDPEQAIVLNYLGYSLLDRNQKIPEALGLIERAVERRPNDGHIIDSLGWGYFLTGRFAEAVVQMEKASLLMPVDPIVTDHLGDVYWAVGRQTEARFQWRRALSFNPTEKDADLIRRKLEKGLEAVLEEEGLPALSDRGKS